MNFGFASSRNCFLIRFRLKPVTNPPFFTPRQFCFVPFSVPKVLCTNIMCLMRSLPFPLPRKTLCTNLVCLFMAQKIVSSPIPSLSLYAFCLFIPFNFQCLGIRDIFCVLWKKIYKEVMEMYYFNIMLGDICVCKLRKKQSRRDRSRQHYATRGGVREKRF